MSIESSINITIVTVIASTLFLVPLWLFSIRPANRSAFDKYGDKTLSASIRSCAAAMAFIASLTIILVGSTGYLWFFGVIAYMYLWIGIMCGADSRLMPKKHGLSMALISLASIVLTVMFGLGWADFCNLLPLPLNVFRLLSGVAVVLLMYVSLRR